VRIVDENGQVLPENGKAIGELQLRGAWVAGGYLNIESDAFTEDGWLRTGDIGSIDYKGYVQLTDRIKDVIKSGGEWISSLDLEDAIAQHGGVAEVAVISIPDERWQERPLAIVVKKQGSDVTPADLRRFLADRVARFWMPEYWCLTNDIEKTSVGKFDKKKLRDLFSTGLIIPEIVKD
jgi:fatty-acyl-CoA synthase